MGSEDDWNRLSVGEERAARAFDDVWRAATTVGHYLTTSRYRVRLDEPSLLGAFQADDRAVPAVDHRGASISLRARAILELGEQGSDGRRPALVRDGRRARRTGFWLISLGLAARLVLPSLLDDRTRGASIGTVAAAQGLLFGVLLFLYGSRADRPTD